MWEVKNVFIPFDYLKVRKLCIDIRKEIVGASEEEIQTLLNPGDYSSWLVDKYRRKVLLDGKLVGFFYAHPSPSQGLKEVKILAWAIEPTLSFTQQIQASLRLLKQAYLDYSAVGTEKAIGTYWVGSPCKNVIDWLDLPSRVSGTDPVLYTPKTFITEVTLAEIKEKLQELGVL